MKLKKRKKEGRKREERGWKGGSSIIDATGHVPSKPRLQLLPRFAALKSYNYMAAPLHAAIIICRVSPLHQIIVITITIIMIMITIMITVTELRNVQFSRQNVVHRTRVLIITPP